MRNDFFSKKFIFFCIIGFINFAINISAYNLLLLLNIHYLIATVFAYFLSILNAYVMNRFFVFKVKHSFNSIVKVYSIYIFSLIVYTFLMYLFVDIMSVNEKIAPIFGVMITTPINFILNKYWGFKGGKVDENN